MLPSTLPHDNILAQVDWWYRTYHAPCPQSHLARSLRLDLPQLRVHLHRLAAAGALAWVESGIPGSPDVARRWR